MAEWRLLVTGCGSCCRLPKETPLEQGTDQHDEVLACSLCGGGRALDAARWRRRRLPRRPASLVLEPRRRDRRRLQRGAAGTRLLTTVVGERGRERMRQPRRRG